MQHRASLRNSLYWIFGTCIKNAIHRSKNHFFCHTPFGGEPGKQAGFSNGLFQKAGICASWAKFQNSPRRQARPIVKSRYPDSVTNERSGTNGGATSVDRPPAKLVFAGRSFKLPNSGEVRMRQLAGASYRKHSARPASKPLPRVHLCQNEGRCLAPIFGHRVTCCEVFGAATT